MAKKRVYEIARDLKAQGVELEGKELVKELNDMDFSVKSPSSSLDEEDAANAVRKIVQKHKGAPPPVKAAGFVVRRRSPARTSEATVPAQKSVASEVKTGSSSSPSASSSAAAPASAARVRPAGKENNPAPDSTAAAAPKVSAPQPAAPVSQTESQTDTASKTAPAEQKGVPAAGVQSASINVSETSTPVAATTTVEAAPEKHQEKATPVKDEVSAPAAQDAKKDEKPVAVTSAGTSSAAVSVSAEDSKDNKADKKDEDEAKKASKEQKTASSTPISSAAGITKPVQGNSTAPQTKGSSVKPAAAVAPAVDPRTLHPTANQAVVLSRPLIPIRRVTPTSDSVRHVPQAPGPRALSNSSSKDNQQGGGRSFGSPSGGYSGNGRRDYDGGREQLGRKRSNARQDVKDSYSKQELLDLARGRTTTIIPRVGKKKKSLKKGVKPQLTQMSEEKKVVKVDESISVAELSQKMGVKAVELMRKLIGLGMMVNVNSPLDIDTASLLVSDYGWRVEKTGFEIEDYITDVPDAPEDLLSRPPVVTIMGHVDHGKTSLLDAIRNAKVAAGEAGGITQHIGAYSVETDSIDSATGKKKVVTFLDTPGHEAFTAMRARGAKVTDLVVIVVAADDGVMPQTREAINHAKAADVPILVAINKIDKPGADPNRVKNQLMEFGLVDESLGGDTIMVPVSAKTKIGLDNLLEMILLQSEVLDLKANPNRKAHGTVVEAKLEKGRGPVATVIVSDGTLRVGDALVSGNQFGRIRAMQNDRGEKVSEVLPGFPVEIIGLDGVPTAGDEFDVVENEAAAKEIAGHRLEKERQKELATSAKVRLEDLFAKATEGTLKELSLVVKADVQGSAEAVSASLAKLATKKVGVKIIHSGVGGINGNDVMLAAASNAIIVGFNVRPELKASELAAQQGVDIRLYSIIYEAVDEVQKAMAGLLEPTKKEKVLGRAEVRDIFTVPKVGTIAGCFVIDGKVLRSAQVRLLRDSKVIYTGKVASLRRFKDDVKEVEKGYECGLSIENFGDIKQGDVIEAFEIEIIRQSLD